MKRMTTTGELVEALQEKLGLHWLAGRQGAERHLEEECPEAETQGLVGPFNWIHPYRVQLVGPAELASFHSMEQTLQKEAVEKLFHCRPAAVVIAEELQVDEEFLRQAERTDTPLLRSPLPTNVLQDHIQHHLTYALAERQTVHGVFLEILGMGVLLTGGSAVGKSELALELIARGNRLIADDAPEFVRVTPDNLNGTCPPLLRDFLEVRGMGLLNIRKMFGDSAIKRKKGLHLIIHLKRMEESELCAIDRLQGGFSERELLGIRIPEVTLPVIAGRELAILAETIVRQHIQQLQGYNAIEDFIARQRSMLEANRRS
jgi:HPr kinase/phosphorylase